MESECFADSTVETKVLPKQSVHFSHLAIAFHPSNILVPYLFGLKKRVFRETDIAFPLSENAGKILKQRGYSGAQIPFPNGVDISLFQKQDMSQLKTSLGLANCFVIGYVGRLIQMKGVDTVIEAGSNA